jgi:prepilin-type N-terminal cleavage/methylation domain-containing protein
LGIVFDAETVSADRKTSKQTLRMACGNLDGIRLNFVIPFTDTSVRHGPPCHQIQAGSMRKQTKTAADDVSGAAVPVSDGGFSLVEVVITIVLIGVVILPLMIASMTSITASSRTREAAETETVLQNAADRLNRAQPNCNYDPYLKAALSAKGWDPANVTATYEHYVTGASVLANTPGTWAPDACGTGATRSAFLIQRVTITVTSPSGRVKQTIKVIKNDV